MNDTIDFYTLDGKIYLIVKEINFNNHKITTFQYKKFYLNKYNLLYLKNSKIIKL